MNAPTDRRRRSRGGDDRVQGLGDERRSPLVRARGLALWRPLAARPFRRHVLGTGLSLFADQAFFVVVTLLVLRVAGPGVELGAVLAVASVPGAVLMPFGGVLSDRFSPAPVMLVASVGRAVLVATLAGLVGLDAVRLWHLYALGAALSAVDALYYPASFAVVPALIPRERLGAANALVQGAEQASEVVGPAAAAGSVAAVGLGPSFGVVALLFAAAAAAFGGLVRVAGGMAPAASSGAPWPDTGESAGTPADGTGGSSGLRAGIRYAWGDPLIRALLLVFAVTELATVGPVVVGGSALAEARFGGAGALGLLFAAWGAGSLLGLVVAGSVARPRHRGGLLLGVTALSGAGLAALGFVPNLPTACAVAAAMGIGSGAVGVVLVAWLQERIAAEFRGRVMGLVAFAAVALDPVSFALAGALTELDPASVFLAAGATMVLAAFGGAASVAVRRFD